MIQPWHMSHRADPAAKALADRHYNRQTPDSPQFAPPGSCAVFLTADARALWVTSSQRPAFVRHAWPGAWVCSAFRSEGGDATASELIRAAVSATRAYYGDPPPQGMITFIDPRKVEPILTHGVPTFGRTWIKAGFRYVGKTKGGLLAYQIVPSDMPLPHSALPRSMHGGAPLFAGAAE